MKEKSFLSYILLAATAIITACTQLPDMETGKQAYNNKDYETAYWNYHGLSEFGLPAAKTELGKFYLYGHGREPDPAQALNLFTEAAALGDKNAARMIPKAQIKLGTQYVASSDPQRKIEGRNLLAKAAATSEPAALFELGQLYEEGSVVPQSGPMADQYYKQAADLDYAKAAFFRARLHQKGELVKQDQALALKLYQEAGQKGYFRAYTEVARIYEKGLNGTPSYDEAYNYYMLAEKNGEPVVNDLKRLQKKIDPRHI